jgi:hypothetical protein
MTCSSARLQPQSWRSAGSSNFGQEPLFLLGPATTPSPGNRFARSLACARVRFGPLPTYRQAAAVAQTAIAPNLDQALDVQLNFAAQLTFNAELADALTQ